MFGPALDHEGADGFGAVDPAGGASGVELAGEGAVLVVLGEGGAAAWGFPCVRVGGAAVDLDEPLWLGAAVAGDPAACGSFAVAGDVLQPGAGGVDVVDGLGEVGFVGGDPSQRVGASEV